MNIRNRRLTTKEKKIPVEELQKQFLQGPADEPLNDTSHNLLENQVVIAQEVPRMEKIIFRNQRDPGMPLEFHFSSKTCPFKAYKLIDGHTYTLPIEVIRNLEGCRHNIEKYRRNSEGLPEVYVAGYNSHFVCERV